MPDFSLSKRAVVLTKAFTASHGKYMQYNKNQKAGESLYNIVPTQTIKTSKLTQAQLIAYALCLYTDNDQFVVEKDGQKLVFDDVNDKVFQHISRTALNDFHTETVDLQVPINSSFLLNAHRPAFKEWDKTERAFYILNNFYKIDVGESESPKLSELQAHLVFFTSMLIHVAVLNDRTALKDGNASYSIIPTLLSRSKNIGKSTFMHQLLTAIPTGGVAEATLETLLDPQLRGRLYHANHAIVLDELSAYTVLKNMNKVKALATQTNYDYDQKYQVAVNRIRQTAIYGTTNDTLEMFSQHETDRRLQLIKIKPLSITERTDFADFDFEQVWAEINYYLQRMKPAEIKQLTEWSEGLTNQNLADEDTSLTEWILEQANALFTNPAIMKTSPNVLDDSDGKKYINPEYLIEKLLDSPKTKAKTRQKILNTLNIKYNSNDDVPCDLVKLRRRLNSFISKNIQTQFDDFADTQKRINGKRMRGYIVKETHAYEHNSDNLDYNAVAERLHDLKVIIDKCKNRDTETAKMLQDHIVTRENTTIINHENLVEFVTHEPLTNKQTAGIIAMYVDKIRDIDYYHYLGLVSDDNIHMLRTDTQPTIYLDHNEVITSVDAEFILINQTLPIPNAFIDGIKAQFNKLEMNAIIPAIAPAYAHRLSDFYHESEILYDVQFDEIFIELKKD